MTPDEIREQARARRDAALGNSGNNAAPPSGTADEIREIARQRREAAEQAGGAGFLRRAGSAIADAGRGVRDMVVGKQDPRFADTPAFDLSAVPLETQAGINRGRAVTFDDEAYGDIVRKQLGNRFLRSERDENNYQLITYLDNEGKERTEYLNRPGLDWDDVDRGIAGSVPFMFGAGVANAGLRGLGAASSVVPRVLAQGGAAGVTSLEADRQAANLGSEQGADLGRAGFAAATGGLFEGLSGPVVATWRRVFRKNPIDPQTGRLNRSASEEARRMGLNPDDMNERLSRQFAADMNVARNPDEVAAKFQAGRFDIPTTQGQRTKDIDQLRLEMDMRKSLAGREAYHVMREFDDTQTRKIGDAVDTIGAQVGRRAEPERAPLRDLGEGIQTGARQSRDILDDQISQRWQGLEEIFPQDGAFANMGGILQSRLNGANVPTIDPDLTPFAHNMMRRLDDYAKRRIMQPEYDFMPTATQIKSVDQFRRQLLGLSQSADAPADRVAARAIYDGYNEWIDEAAERALLSGAPDIANRLKSVRGFTREVKQLLQPTDVRGQLTPGARKLGRVIDKADSGEGVVRELFGASVTKPPPVGNVDALRHMRDMMIRTGNEEAWDNVRMAFWQKLAHNPNGATLTPTKLGGNIKTAFEQNKTVMDLLYTPYEQGMIRDLGRVMDDVITTPLNPSGTSYELRAAAQQGAPLAKSILEMQSASARLRYAGQGGIGNLLMMRIWSGLAKRVPNKGVQDSMGRGIAQRATSQEVGRRAPGAPFLAPIGATGAANVND